MLLTKKNKFRIDEGQIKEDVLSAEGELLLKINLRYPDIKCRKNDPMAVFARDFYPRIAKSFAEYAKSELFSVAQKARKAAPEGFLPFSAVMRYELTYEDERFLSVVLYISVSDGSGAPSAERKTQVWEREYGTKCKPTYFLSKKEIDDFIKENLTEDDKKLFDREMFVLRESGLEFFVRKGGAYASVVIPFLQKNPIKVTE